MTQDRITTDDLGWWVRKAATLEWTYAKTYADTAPHHYVVLDKTEGMSADDFVRAGRVIHTFGRPMKFYDSTDIYLESPSHRWWTMDRDVRETTLINRSTVDRMFGVQNAPDTQSLVRSPYDELASGWDAAHPTSPELEAALREAFAQLRSKYPPSVLDVGCGTGRVLDLGLARPERYAGIDPSSAMLNQLVRKHPRVGAVYPWAMTAADARSTFSYGQFEIVTALMPEGAGLDPALIEGLRHVASRGVVVGDGDRVAVFAAKP